MRLRSILLTVSMLLVLGVAPASAAPGGLTAQTLLDAGWSCIYVSGLGTHCFAPGGGNSQQTTPVMYFTDSQVQDLSAAFAGTELLMSHDTYNGQRCPQEGIDEWHNIGFARACHHN